MADPSYRLSVSVSTQKLSVWNDAEKVWDTDVSTSLRGTGCDEGSYQTPTGRFHIAAKLGEGEPLYTVFKGRKPAGIWDPQSPPTEEDLILTRILWLTGDEPANRNTQERYIYFHGTNQEHLIGTPSSHGCIRLRNEDMIKLFNYTKVGSPVEISE